MEFQRAAIVMDAMDGATRNANELSRSRKFCRTRYSPPRTIGSSAAPHNRKSERETNIGTNTFTYLYILYVYIYSERKRKIGKSIDQWMLARLPRPRRRVSVVCLLSFLFSAGTRETLHTSLHSYISRLHFAMDK